MRLSILCVRDDFYIFYIGLFHGSSVLPDKLNCYSGCFGSPANPTAKSSSVGM